MFNNMTGGMMRRRILAAQMWAETTKLLGSSGSVSLGGGLAGYIGLTSGTRSVLFDHLPFESANDNQARRIAA
jgi:hypothetical protein